MAEALCLVVDTGVTSSREQQPGQATFLTRALHCASSFVERKLYSESKDVLGLVLFGCEETVNTLDYPGVKVVERGLAIADWDTVSFLREHVRGTQVEGDWVDALVVALDFLKSQTEGKKYSALKIVMFSELGCPADNDEDQIELIIQGMKTLDNIDFTHIGPDWGEDSDGDGGGGDVGPDSQGGAGPGPSNGVSPGASNGVGGPRQNNLQQSRKPRTKIQLANEELVARLVHETDGMMCTLEEALAAFLYRNKRGKKSMPWKVNLEIGPDIRIATAGYVRVRREPPKTWKKCLARVNNPEDAEIELKADVTYVRNTEEQEEVDPEDLVLAYRYGPEMVVISKEDEDAARHKGEDGKVLSLFGFINRGEIRSSDLVGEGSMVFLPQEDDSNSETALAALCQAMMEMGVVAVVRKAYRKGSSAKLGVLAPESDGEGGILLAYAELPFAEEVRELSFPSLPQPNEEQLSAVDDLIDVMMLTQGEEEDRVEVMKTDEMLNPSYQYLYQALTERALRAGCVIPSPAEHIVDMLRPPDEIINAMAPHASRLQEVFTTEEVVKKTNKRTADAVLGKDEEIEEPEKRPKVEELELGVSVTEVGSTNPVEDFQHLIGRGLAIEGVSQQLETVVMRLLSTAFGSDMDTKVLACLTAYRREAERAGSHGLYNDFLRKLKSSIGGSGRLWLGLVEANLGLLPGEGLTQAEMEAFLLPPNLEGDGVQTAQEEEEEEDDLLDQL